MNYDWDEYSLYCDHMRDRECYYEDTFSYERQKELDAWEDVYENVKSILDQVSYADLKGKEELQRSLFNLCDLLKIDATILHEKITNTHHVA